MARFSDTNGRPWDVRIDINAIRRVRAAFGLDLAKILASPDSLAALYGDIVQLVDVIYTICKPQADASGVSDIQFGEGLAGDVLGMAIEAFEQAAIDFLPESRRRTLLRQILDSGKAVQAQATLRIENAIRDGLIEQGIREEMERIDTQIAQLKSNLSVTVTGPSS